MRLALVALCLGSLSACGTDNEQRAALQQTPSPTATAYPPPEEDDGAYPSPAPVPAWDAASRASATDLAGRVMRAFLRRDLPQKQWWAQLSPMLSATAAQAYQYVDPQYGGPISVRGNPRLLAEESVYLARVQVRSSAGAWIVLLSREGKGSPWRVERMTPPTGVH